MSDLKGVLERLYASRSSGCLDNDPLSFCHRYDDPADREVAAVISSSFAYGGINIILRTLESIFFRLGPSPCRTVMETAPQRLLKTFAGFRHRFNDGRDLTALLWALRQMIEQSGSVERFFLRFWRADDMDIGPALDGYTRSVLAMDYRPVFGSAGLPGDSYFRFLFPAPSSGSACKRLCMFLRWVVRPADGIDLGLWSGVAPSQLVIPVDTHVRRIAGYLGLTARRQADWRMATEITAALRCFDHADPVRYDFALAHLGISAGCDGKDRELCRECLLHGVCRAAGG